MFKSKLELIEDAYGIGSPEKTTYNFADTDFQKRHFDLELTLVNENFQNQCIYSVDCKDFLSFFSYSKKWTPVALDWIHKT